MVCPIVIRRLHKHLLLVLIFSISMILLLFNASTAFVSMGPIGRQGGVFQESAKSPDLSASERGLENKGFVNVRDLDSSIMVDLKYARPDNFMKTDIYGDLTRAYLLPGAAEKLALASRILQHRYPELRLLVVDALRPRFVQQKMWDTVSNTAMQPYVANPRSGSMHNYGAAVDVTLYDVEKQEPLDMGTPIDHFGPLAQPLLEAEFLRQGKLTKEQVENRRLLRNIMTEAGWHMINIEWWHFDAYPVLYIRQNYTIVE
jgi:zinc D-Ala-D-Ala dipeptidase